MTLVFCVYPAVGAIVRVAVSFFGYFSDSLEFSSFQDVFHFLCAVHFNLHELLCTKSYISFMTILLSKRKKKHKTSFFHLHWSRFGSGISAQLLIKSRLYLDGNRMTAFSFRTVRASAYFCLRTSSLILAYCISSIFA